MLEKNLPVLLKLAPAEQIKQIIVVDDASTDDSLAYLAQFSQIELIAKPTNSGFSATVNLGVKHAKHPIVLLLNSDARPLPGFAQPALRHFQDPRVFSVSCNDGGTWADGYLKHGLLQHTAGKPSDSTHLTLWTSGGHGFFRTKYWRKLGGMDEMYHPFYWEDIDLGWRAWKAGYINLWEPQAKLQHMTKTGVIKTNFSAEFIHQISARNQFLFAWKNLDKSTLLSQFKLLPQLARHPGMAKSLLAAAPFLPQVIRKRQLQTPNWQLTDQQILDQIHQT